MQGAQAFRRAFPGAWKERLGAAFEERLLDRLFENVAREYAERTVFPPAWAVFKALELTPPESTKVVIVGQDPYPGPGEATGIAFGVHDEARRPPTLINILQELASDLDLHYRDNLVSRPLVPQDKNSLEGWARQGVLLLNSHLSVRVGVAGSHAALGWSVLTDALFGCISRNRAVAFLLWGKHAQAKQTLVTNPKHLVLTAAHPSPLSADKGFFGCRHFTQTNDYLIEQGEVPVNWLQLS